MYRWPDVVLLLTTRCLYQGLHLTVHCILNCILQNVKMTLHGTALGHQMPLLWGTSASANLNTLCILCFASQWSFLQNTKKSGVIYIFKCGGLECGEYIGESSRTFGERLKEHLKATTPIYDHSNTAGYTTSVGNFSVVGREDQHLTRTIRIINNVNNLSLNKNNGKYYAILFNTSELKLK